MASTLVHYEGSFSVDEEVLARVLGALAAALGPTLSAATAQPRDNTELAASVVDTSTDAITAAEATARPFGWNHSLAVAWCEELWNTVNGRTLHELPVAQGGYATAAEMRVAVGRDVDAAYGLSGFTGGVSKRWKRWVAATPAAAGLTMPVETDYDPAVTSRQRARGFKVSAELVPLFAIAIEQTKE